MLLNVKDIDKCVSLVARVSGWRKKDVLLEGYYDFSLVEMLESPDYTVIDFKVYNGNISVRVEDFPDGNREYSVYIPSLKIMFHNDMTLKEVCKIMNKSHKYVRNVITMDIITGRLQYGEDGNYE